MGNLLARVTAKKLTKKLDAPELMYTMPEKLEAEDAQLVKLLEELPGTGLFRCFAAALSLTAGHLPVDVFEQHLSSFEVHRALAAVFDALAEANRHVQQLSPWLATASPSAVHRALFFGSETLRMSAILLQPFMPTKSEQLLDMLGVPADRRAWACRYFGQGGARVAVTGGKTHLWPPILTAAEPTAQS